MRPMDVVPPAEPPADPNAFAEQLRERRRAAGLTQEALAERAGLSARAISDLERGLKAPQRATVDLLARAFGLPPGDAAAFALAARRRARRDAGAEGTGLGGHTLPVPLTRLVGRERETAALIARLGNEQTRLLTLVGPGGVGKTRLALHVAAALAARFADGAAFASLAGVTRPGQAAAAVVQTLRLHPGPARSVEETLHDHLRARALLLVLDNLEQVPDAAELAVGLLGQAPNLAILATSRAALRAYGEREFPVPPLALPAARAAPSLEALGASEAIRLFVERARAVHPAFALTAVNAEAILAICRRLDGLPLALELAAARLRLLTPEALLARLERRLPLLTGGARDLPVRRQTLRATIAWSYDLLLPAEQALFRRLAVFAGGCMMDAAAAVVTAAGPLGVDVLDGLEALAAQSLVQQVEGVGGARIALLETIREFGLEQLELAGEAIATRSAHFSQILARFEQGNRAIQGADQVAELARLDEEGPDLQQAIAWGVGQGEATRLLRLVVAAFSYLHHRGRIREAIEGLEAALALPGGAPGPRSVALTWLGGVLWFRGDRQAGRRRVEEAYALARAADARYALAVATAHRGYTCDEVSAAYGWYEEAVAQAREIADPYLLANTLLFASAMAFRLGDRAAGERRLTESGQLYRALGNPFDLSVYTVVVARRALADGDLAGAARHYEENLRRSRTLGNPWTVADAHLALGRVAMRATDWPGARARYEAAVAAFRELGLRASLSEAQAELAAVALAQEQRAEARERLAEALHLGREIADPKALAPALAGMAALAVAIGCFDRALRLYGAATALRGQGGVDLESAGLEHADPWIARARTALGGDAAAVEASGQALTPDEAVAVAQEGLG